MSPKPTYEELERKIKKLEKESVKRRRADERIEHLNAVLRAIRNVNQLITTEKDQQKLIQGACDSLVETRGYHKVWLAVMDESEGVVTAANAGWGDDFLPFVKRMKRGELPDCGKRALTKTDVEVVEDPSSSCSDCPLACKCVDSGAMTFRLEHGGTIYGLLSAIIPIKFITDEEEKALFKEVAKDIAFALHDMELEKKRRSTEEALRETRDYLNNLINYANAPIIVWNPDRKITLFNHAFKHLAGYAADEVIGQDIQVLFPEEKRDESLSRITSALAGEYWESVEIPILCKDGDVRVALWNSANIYAEDGKTLIATIAQGQDITERKQAEERLSQIVEGSPVPIFVINDKHNITHWNIACENLTGISRDEVIGTRKQWMAFYPAERPTMADLMVDGVSEEEISRYYSGRYRKSAIMEGAYVVEDFFPDLGESGRWLFFTSTPLRDFKGNIIGAIETLRDITDRKRSEEKLKEYSEKLEEMVEKRTKELRDAQEQLVRKEKLAILGQLAGSVGHELRNPLGVISNAVYYLKMVLPDADTTTTKEYMDIISSEVRNSEEIVSDLLDFSRVRQVEKEEIAIIDLATRALEKQPPPDDVEVVTKIPVDLLSVHVDTRQIGQVLLNLISNAYQAMPEGGSLTIQAKGDRDNIRLSVTDTGSGISEENMENIFNPLFTTRARGIGLGLVISRNLIEANEGRIEVKSEEGRGSTFTITLPAKDEE